MVKWYNIGIINNNIDPSPQVWNISMALFTLYMYSIRKVIMYNCHLHTQPSDLEPFKGCYSVTSTERSFSRAENLCFSGTNQKPERRRPFGTGLVKHCPQGLFSPFFTFLRALFFRPFRLSLAPAIRRWVSEDELTQKQQTKKQKMLI